MFFPPSFFQMLNTLRSFSFLPKSLPTHFHNCRFLFCFSHFSSSFVWFSVLGLFLKCRTHSGAFYPSPIHFQAFSQPFSSISAWSSSNTSSSNYFPSQYSIYSRRDFLWIVWPFSWEKKPSDIYISRAGQSSADKGILAFSLKTFRPFQVFESRSHLAKKEKGMIASDHSILLQNQSFLLLHEILIISFNSIVWNWIIFHLSNHIRCFYNISNFELHKKHKQISQIFSIVCVWKVHHVSGFHQT